MNLKLDDKYSVSSDKYNFILEKLEDVTNKETKEVTQKLKDPRFFGKFEHVLEHYLYERIKESECSSPEELLKFLKEVKVHIDKIVKRENITLKDFQNESV